MDRIGTGRAGLRDDSGAREHFLPGTQPDATPRILIVGEAGFQTGGIFDDDFEFRAVFAACNQGIASSRREGNPALTGKSLAWNSDCGRHEPRLKLMISRQSRWAEIDYYRLIRPR
jgi:hypothetical protein